MVTFSMTFTEPQPGFQGHGILKYLKNGASHGQSYYSTLIGLETIPNIWNGTMFGDLD